MSRLLAVDGLTVEFAAATGWQAVVEDVTFDVGAGEVVAHRRRERFGQVRDVARGRCGSCRRGRVG